LLVQPFAQFIILWDDAAMTQDAFQEVRVLDET
jgi:hypothetical protein